MFLRGIERCKERRGWKVEGWRREREGGIERKRDRGQEGGREGGRERKRDRGRKMGGGERGR